MNPEDEAPWIPDRRLPRGFRGRRGYGRLLEAVPLRVSVSGIRGKSALTRMTADALCARGYSVYAKITGTDPVSYKNGTLHPICRDPRRKAVIDETFHEVMRHWPMDAMVLENQAITPYTMRVFNEMFCRPHYLAITNIRRDHQGDIARGIDRIAEAFGRSTPEGATLISGERDPSIKAVLRGAVAEVAGRFMDAAPTQTDVPGFENVKIVHALLKDTTGTGLSLDQVRAEHRRLERIFTWRDSAHADVAWFHGAEINDVDSTRLVLTHLLRKQRFPVIAVAYLRRDRVDRTASFVPYLSDLLARGTVDTVHLAGDRARVVARRLRRHGPVEVWRDDPQHARMLLQRLRRDARGKAVFTMVNAVPPWPRIVAEGLDAQRPETGGIGPTTAPPVRHAQLRSLPADTPAWHPA